MDIDGKVILITGAARGIGQACAQIFAAAGAKVVAADLNDCAETVALGRDGPGSIIAAHLDVTDAQSAQEAVAVAVSHFSRLDALVNNAALYGGLKSSRFENLREADWDAAMTVNVKGIWNCCKAAVPEMRKAGGGSIINISSMSATYGTPFMLHYVTSKSAVLGMTRGLARELGRDNIRVNTVAPTAVTTEGTKEFFGDKSDRALEQVKTIQALQGNLDPSDLAGTIGWLIGDGSRFVTGQTISVDGGAVML
ncbi:SDR family NAD(P)-dependent oxidoreductase [Propylenella binzhouense]|uniref:SDR family oxidoreductase n=1 Tax=Propylenella binzhouense TaxID=2555902 RepID=A0A964T162_9HYPH|nr:SDR family oxidoreductase [Propylenella binzhouense]MYZ46410.1 SDR family oxidoreductase [Propylenella binzhouense]